jgi:hypothetical protein
LLDCARVTASARDFGGRDPCFDGHAHDPLERSEHLTNAVMAA